MIGRPDLDDFEAGALYRHDSDARLTILTVFSSLELIERTAEYRESREENAFRDQRRGLDAAAVKGGAYAFGGGIDPERSVGASGVDEP